MIAVHGGILGKQSVKYQKTINISHLFSFVSALSWQDFNSSGSQRSSEELSKKLKGRRMNPLKTLAIRLR